MVLPIEHRDGDEHASTNARVHYPRGDARRRDRLAAGRSFDRLALGVAAWMRYVGGIDEQSQPIDVRDPLADRLKSLPDAASLLGVREVFGDDLPNNPTFVATVTDALDRLKAQGARDAVQSLTR